MDWRCTLAVPRVFHLARLGRIDRRGTVSMAEIIRRERRNDLYRVTGSGV